MAFFRRKKDTNAPDDGTPPADGGDSAEGFQPQPEKARKWFEHGTSMVDRSDFAYALMCFANAIKLDPEPMIYHETMYEAGVHYLKKGGKAAASKELRTLADKPNTPASRLAAAEFAWMKDLRNAALGLKAMEAAVGAELFEAAHWMSPKVLQLLKSQKKLNKSQLLQAKDIFLRASAFNEALDAAEIALQLDPSDNALAHEIKDISAQRAMDQGGYEKAAGQEGGFRSFIKDADKQRELIESEAISSSEDAELRNLTRAKAAYEQTPTIPDVINQYGTLLRKEGSPESMKVAYDVYMKGFTETNEYRFRMLAGDINIDQHRRELQKLADQLKAKPDDAELTAKHKEARQALLELQAAEYTERVEKYPTDRHRKFELGRVLYELGRYEDAMGQFQAAKEEPRLRVRAGHLLGRCFAKENWHREAIGEFKESIAAIDATEKERELAIRYDLMVSLIAQSQEEKSLDLGREALDICSGIARKDITYRDIRGKRKEIDQVIRDLSGGESS